MFNKVEKATDIKVNEQMSIEDMSEYFALTAKEKAQIAKESTHYVTITYSRIQKEQNHCPELKKLLNYPDCPYQTEEFLGGGKRLFYIKTMVKS